MEQFTTSNGIQYILTWGFCRCYIWKVAWVYGQEYAGYCGRCGEGVRFAPFDWSYEDTLERFRSEYGREPANF